MGLPLAELFWAERPQAERHAPTAELEALLSALLRAGTEAWPGVGLPAPVFMRHLAAHAPMGEDVTSFLSSINGKDLYLACACARGETGALAALEQAVLRRVPEFLAGIDGSPELAGEIQQILRTRLLVAAEGERPKIGDYSGRGNLYAWARVIAVREALHLKERAGRDRPIDEDERGFDLPAGVDVEMDYLKARYKQAFEAAVRDAVAGLTGEQRSLLRLHHEGGLSTIKLGQMFQVNQSTASRWLKECHQALFRQIEALLHERLKVSPSELQSLSRLVRSQLHLSLAKLLHEGPGAA